MEFHSGQANKKNDILDYLWSTISLQQFFETILSEAHEREIIAVKRSYNNSGSPIIFKPDIRTSRSNVTTLRWLDNTTELRTKGVWHLHDPYMQ